MKKPKINVVITKENKGYSATVSSVKDFIGTQGENYSDLKTNILDAINLAYEDKGWIFSMEDITISFDLQSFFDFYKVINAKALSERIGMNQSLLAQYISGKKKPSAVQTNRILK